MISALPEWLQDKIYIEPNSGCWLWLGLLNEDGYARSSGKWKYLHRRIYEFFFGPIPPSKELDHRCRTRSCLNPRHLNPITHLENIQRGAVNQNKGRTHCRRGHEFNFENTLISNGKRHCKACKELWRKTHWKPPEYPRGMHPNSRRWKKTNNNTEKEG